MKLSLTTQAGLLAASRAVAQVLNALVGIVVVRFLSQEDYGTFRQVYLLYGTLVIMTDLGLSESLYYFLPRMPQRRAGIVLWSVSLVGMMQVAAGAALMLAREPIGGFFNNPDLPHYMGLLALFLGMSTLTRLWEVQLIAEQRVPLASVITSGFEALKVSLMFAALVRPSIESLLWAMVASTAAKFLCYLGFLARDWPAARSAAGPADGGHFRYAMALWVPGVLNTMAIYAHQYIVGYSFTPSEYAVYSVACFQVPLVGVLTNSILEVLLVRITAARAQSRPDKVQEVWENASRKSLLVFIPLAVCMGVLAQPLITLLFTSTYAVAAPLFAVLMLGIPLNVIATNNILRAYNAMGDYAKFYAAKLVLGLVLGAVGAYWFGMWGAAVSSVLALYLVTGWQLRRVAELLGVAWMRILPWGAVARTLTASVVAAVPAALCARFSTHPAVALVTGLPVYLVLYVLLVSRMGLVEWEGLRNLGREMGQVVRVGRAR